MKNQSTLKVGRGLAFAWAIILLSTSHASAQQTLTTVNGWNAYVHLPDDYNSTGNKKYPTIIFFPGTGETGTNPALLLTYGPSNFINQGYNLDSFLVNGSWIKPIIISLQPPYLYPQPITLDIMFDSVIARWRVDPTQLDLTGLSMGGFCGDNYVTASPAYASRINAMVNMSAVIPNNPLTDFSYFALSGGKGWWFEGTQDYRDMSLIVDTMNAYAPGSGRYTSYVGGHCCWNTWYIPTYTENVNGQTWNIYQWLLAQSKSAQPPVANAGSNVIIYAPVDSTSLNGTGSSDPDGTISSYTWTKLAGPAQFTLNNPNLAMAKASNLTLGTYTFQLTVMDNHGMSSSAQVQVLSTIILPIEFLSFSGQSNPDGNFLIWQTSGDDGSYSVERSDDGKNFIDLTSIAAQQTDVTKHTYTYTDLNPPPGVGQYRIKNISAAGTIKFTDVVQIDRTLSGVSWSYYPNPAKDNITMQFQSSGTGTVMIRLIALDGRQVLAAQDQKQGQSYSKQLDLSSLAPGMYFLSLRVGDGPQQLGKLVVSH
jgi:hypothetical protein